MILLDTDHTTFLKYPESERGRRLIGRLDAVPASEVVRSPAMMASEAAGASRSCNLCGQVFMDGSFVTPRARSSPGESRGTTLADLILLTAGSALLWVIPWFGFAPSRVAWIPARWDWQWVYVMTAISTEGAERLCLVLMILVFARKLRSGGVVHPAEYLLGYVAIRLFLTPRAGSMWALFVGSPAGIGSAFAVVSLSSLAILGGRGRCPGSIGTTLRLVAYASLGCLNVGVGEQAYRLVLSAGWPPGCEIPLLGLVSFPGRFLFAAPYAAAAWNSPRRRHRWSWIEWSGVVLATGWFLGEQAHIFASAIHSTPIWYFMTCVVADWVLMLAAISISLGVGRRLGPVRGEEAPAIT